MDDIHNIHCVLNKNLIGPITNIKNNLFCSFNAIYARTIVFFDDAALLNTIGGLRAKV